MGKDLIIVESPTKARTITRILGNDFKIMASVGHVRDLPEKELGIDVANGFKLVYETSTRGAKVVAELSKAVKDADHVFLATDPDREGEAIAWHLYELLKTKNKKSTFQRVTFHEITKSAVLDAFKHPHQVNMDRVDAQQARRVVDRLVGWEVSKLLWRRITNATSAGRVQSVAVRLICEREREITSFVSQEYWQFAATFKHLPTKEHFTARLGRIDGEKVDVSDAAKADAYAADAEKGDYRVTKVSRSPRSKRAAPPFITSTLQQAASSNLRFNPDQTMRLAQQLYEGIDLGDGTSGLITYMRTDSVNISKEAQAAARTFITHEFGADFVPDKPNFYKSRSSAQEAHEAIRPTDISQTPEKVKPYLDDRQLKLYRLIWNRFVASQMAPAKLSLHQVELTSLKGTSKHTYLFRASSTKVVFPGYMKVYDLADVEKDGSGKSGPKSPESAEDEDDDLTDSLPDMHEKDACSLNELKREQKFTEPPPRFSEATLVRELESNGVGRPSTYASIINTIQKREYVAKEKGKLVPTTLGMKVNDYLIGNIPSLFDVKFTARMEEELDIVEQGKMDWVKMLEEFYGKFSGWMTEARVGNAPELATVQAVVDCFPEDVAWAPAEKRGTKTYDDRKYLVDVNKHLTAGKALSERQWNALLTMAVRYEPQVKGLDAIAARVGFAEQLDELRTKQSQRAEDAANAVPDEEALSLCRLLDGVKEWEAPEKRGKRTYDDKKFYVSLTEQAQAGRKLSDPQRGALQKLVLKYRAQIPDFDSVAKDVGLTEITEALPDSGEVEVLVTLGDTIGEWKESANKKFDDKSFFESLSRQFRQRRSLSVKQVSALKKLLARYKDQIPDFAERTAGMEFPAGRAPRGAAAVDADGKPVAKTAARATPPLSDVVCPECGEHKLVERRSRRGPFVGCSGYPACKFTAKTLDEVRDSARDGDGDGGTAKTPKATKSARSAKGARKGPSFSDVDGSDDDGGGRGIPDDDAE